MSRNFSLFSFAPIHSKASALSRLEIMYATVFRKYVMYGPGAKVCQYQNYKTAGYRLRSIFETFKQSSFSMAITNNDTRFLFYAKKLGCDFTSTLMLGRLRLAATHDYIKHCVAQYGSNVKRFEEVVFKDDYSEPLFEILGAEKVESMDYSNYENATIIHDMNLPFPSELRGKFSAIVDGGTLEHIFNFPAAIKNCMSALKTGGHFIGITPANNLMGHGFYQFSPELYYRVFSEANGFTVKKMLITSAENLNRPTKWYEVANPDKVKDRVTLVNQKPLYILVLAQKTEEREIFSSAPQQSDYAAVWAITNSLKGDTKSEQDSTIKFLYRKYVPVRIKTILRNLYLAVNKNTTHSEELGEINRGHFKEFKED